ncbi:hypothetical protein LTS18_007028, partial [Coniosporium uncinatum]
DLHYEVFWLLGGELQRAVDRLRMDEEGMHLLGLYEFEENARLTTIPKLARGCEKEKEKQSAELELKPGGLAIWENGMVTPAQSPSEELQLPQ